MFQTLQGILRDYQEIRRHLPTKPLQNKCTSCMSTVIDIANLCKKHCSRRSTEPILMQLDKLKEINTQENAEARAPEEAEAKARRRIEKSTSRLNDCLQYYKRTYTGDAHSRQSYQSRNKPKKGLASIIRMSVGRFGYCDGSEWECE